MVTSVSDLGQFNYLQGMMQSTQQNLDTVTNQLSDGLVADTYAGLGGNATYQALTLTKQQNDLTTYNNNINSVTAKTSAMDAAMSNVTTMANSMVKSLTQVTQSGNPGMTTLNQQAQNDLTQLQSYLNTQVSGDYIFAASDTQTAPVASTSAINTSVNTDLSAFYAGTETTTQVATNVGTYTNAQMGYSSTLSAATDVSVNTGPGVQTDYTVRADSAGFQNIQKGLAIIANLQYGNGESESDFYTVYNNAVSLIQQGSAQVTQSQASLGIATKSMTDTQTAISATQTTLTKSLSNVEDVNAAEASTQLQELENQLQVSYSVMAQVKNLSLLNYLTSTGSGS
jgi:flagellar hook-associated protein 3 FlgL